MANDEQLEILSRGVKAWNAWRRKNPRIMPDLSYANLEAESCDGADFRQVNFFQANLCGEASFNHCDFRGSTFEFTDLLDSYCINSNFRGALFLNANLSELDCSNADFRDAQLHSCKLAAADFSGTDFRGADFNYSDLSHSTFEKADLRGADLTGTQLVGTRFAGADLTGANVYGVTPWEVVLDGAIQQDLVIRNHPRVTVDDFELAQFMHLLIDNRSLRRVIDTLTSRVVLVLGRFGNTRQDCLDLLQKRIRARNLVPLSVDLGKAKRTEIMETSTLLARLARFVIADLSNAPEILQVLEAIVPEVTVPVLPIDSSARGRRLQFADAWKYPWYFEPTPYKNTAELAKVLAPAWFNRADTKREELSAKRVASAG